VIDRIRIYYTIAWMEMGGSQTHLMQVLRLLDRDTFEPVLCCLTGKGALLERARASGATVVDLGMRSFRSLDMAAGVAKLARELRRGRADVVHNYLLRANVVGSLAARAAGVPAVLCSKRGCHWRRGWELAGARLSNRLAHRVTCNAEAVREFVHENERCPKEKMVVIPSGVDTDRFRPLPPGDYKARLGLDPTRPVVGIVTRMRVRKGVEEFLRAMAVVRERRPDAEIVIVGEVALDEDLQRLVDETRLRDHLRLLGRRSDIPEVLSAFDVFVLSSHDEGMSNAILEAMSMELPVVATDVGGTGEVVRQGATGLLVPPKEVAPLAAAIEDVLNDPERGRRMGRLGREIVQERFSARAMVRQMQSLYITLLRERGVRLPAHLPAEATP
jgi:glycosyltransferase involved in cell wall biosynthesis